MKKELRSDAPPSVIGPRWWYPRGTTVLTGTDHLLLDPRGPGRSLNAELATLGSLVDLTCLILLGEPGSGKSAEVRREFEDLRNRGIACALIDCRDIVSADTLPEYFGSNETIAAWMKNDTLLMLFVDSFDEGLLSSATLAAAFAHLLTQIDTNRLSLRIACRTADWPGPFESTLSSLFDKVTALEIAPLTRDDVVAAAVSRLQDAEAFIEAANAAGADLQLARPITLMLLLTIYERDHQLPAQRTEIYRRGTHALCEEVNPHRRARRQTGLLSPDQRMAVAARLAAVSVFANHTGIWRDLDLGNTPLTDVTLGDLTWGHEPLRIGEGSGVEVSAVVLDETLRVTGLFSSGGAGRLIWGHRSYAEYLAAHWIAVRQLPEPVIESLLLTPVEKDRRVPPQLRETASWLAVMSDQAFELLLAVDPAVLVLSDVIAASPEKLERLVARLLYAAEHHEGPETTAALLSRVAHPGLSRQLKVELGPDSHAQRRELALEIAEAVRIEELVTDIAVIAFDRTASQRVRRAAVRALRAIDTEEAASHLLEIADLPTDEDPDQELLGLALRGLWPKYLIFSELLQLLRPIHRDAFLGSYKFFLGHLAQEMNGEQALAYLRHVDSGHIQVSRFKWYIESVIANACASIATADDAAVVARTLAALLRSDWSFLRSSEARPIVESMRANPEGRRSLLYQLSLLGSQAVHDTADTSWRLKSFLEPADAEWALRLLMTHTGDAEDAEEGLVTLIQYTLDRSSGTAISLLIEAYPMSALLAETFGPLEMAIASPEAQRAREFEATMRRVSAPVEDQPLSPTASERVERALAASESGTAEAWIRLDLHLTLDERSIRYDDAAALRTDSRDASGWRAASPEMRVRIVAAAERFLRTVDPKTEQWVSTHTIPWAVLAGFRALRLMMEESPRKFAEFDESIWTRWCGVPFRFFVGDQQTDAEDVRRSLVAIALAKAPKETESFIEASLSYEDTTNGSFFVLDAFETAWPKQVSELVLRRAADIATSPAGAAQLIRLVIERGLPNDRARARRFAWRLLTTATQSVDEMGERLIAFAAVLLLDASKQWDHVLEVLTRRHPVTEFRRVVLTVSQKEEKVQSLINELREDQLAKLFLALVRTFPYDEDPQYHDIQVHTVGPDESARQWRDRVLRALQGRATDEAIAQLRWLRRELPDLPWLSWQIAEARVERARVGWRPATLSELRALTSDSDKRLVRNDTELLSAALESLDRFQRWLTGDTPAVDTLWDQLSADAFRPKAENALADAVKRHLHQDLKGRGIIANREVEIRRGIGGTTGSRTDIHVDATSRDAVGRVDTVTVVIEVKGAWNAETATAVETQLIDRYLFPAGDARAGIYLVGWYDSLLWDKRDARRTRARKHGTPAKLARLLRRQASRSADGLKVEIRILDVRLGLADRPDSDSLRPRRRRRIAAK